MVATYDNLGVKFSYPENWRITEDQTNAWPRSVSVHSPTEAFWTLMIYEPGTELEALVDAVRDALSEEYTDFESVPAEQTIEGVDLIGYDLNFYCLDFLVQAKIRALMLGVRPCVILYQGEDREFDEMERVFSAITHDLIRS